MAAIIGKRVPAATLVETIVAFTIILFIFSIASMVFVQTTKGNVTVRALQAEGLLMELRQKTIAEKDYTDNTILKEGVILKRRVIPYRKIPGLLLVTYSAYTERRIFIRSIHQLRLIHSE